MREVGRMGMRSSLPIPFVRCVYVSIHERHCLKLRNLFFRITECNPWETSVRICIVGTLLGNEPGR